MARKAVFRSDRLREIYQSALKQGWEADSRASQSGHVFLMCPHDECYDRETFSLSARGFVHEIGRKVTNMRRHGFRWDGRGGDHVAEMLTRKVSV